MVKEQSSKSNRGDDSTSPSNEHKSIGTIVSQSLAEESQEGVDRILSELKSYFDSGRAYIQENPREAAGLAIAAGLTAWAMLGTKPGRVLFEAGAAIAVPYVAKWLRGNLNTISH